MFQDDCSRNNRPPESDKALGFVETPDNKLQLAKEEGEVIKTSSGSILKACCEVAYLPIRLITGVIQIVKVFTPKDPTLMP